MPFRPSEDLRLYVNGCPVSGTDDDSRTLRSMSRSASHMAYPRTSIGDAAARHEYLRRRSGTLTVSGFYDDRFGLAPMLIDGTPRAGGAARPVTFSIQGDRAGSRSTIAPAVVWTTETVTSSDDEPVMVEAEGQFSEFRSALFVHEGRVSGGGATNVGNLDLRSEPIPIRLTTNRLDLLGGNREYDLQMLTSEAQRHLLVGDDIELDGSTITGTFRVRTIVLGSPWADVTISREPPADLSAITLEQRRAVTGIRVVDTFGGERIGLAHVSNINQRDAVTLEVAVQGAAPGSTSFADFGPAQQVPVGGQGAAFHRAFYIVGSGRSITRARLQLRWLLSGGAQGAGNNYEADVRFDFAPRVVHHG